MVGILFLDTIPNTHQEVNNVLESVKENKDWYNSELERLESRIDGIDPVNTLKESGNKITTWAYSVPVELNGQSVTWLIIDASELGTGELDLSNVLLPEFQQALIDKSE